MAKTYAERKKQVAEILARKRKAARDIGGIPAVLNLQRREACRLNFRLFCETYFPFVFNLAWSGDHLRVIAKIEQVVLSGGLFAMAMPRGTGKSKLCDAAACWATLYGHRSFVVLVGASEPKAVERMEAIKGALEDNTLLHEDFPEVCYPILRLERATNRSKQQTYMGKFTQIEWKDKSVRLPMIEGSVASGAGIKVTGITGSIRGMNLARGAESIRPDLVFIDDPQTEGSAASKTQIDKLFRIINGAILGLAGPGKKIAAFMPCTVIENDDLAERVLDRQKNPAWQGERIKLMRAMPTNTPLWERYNELREDGLRNDGDISRATEFYRTNREAMDAGADASWPARFDRDEISAVQFGMNKYFHDQASFFAELQNEPMQLELGDVLNLESKDLTQKIHSSKALSRGIVPLNSSVVTAYIDVQKSLLFYNVLSTDNDFSGHVTEYGTFPDQKRSNFTVRQIAENGNSLQRMYPTLGLEGQLYTALNALIDSLVEREWSVEGGNGTRKITRILIDSQWGESTEVVRKVCRESKYAALLYPAEGIGMTPDRKALNDYDDKPGERKGWNWRTYSQPFKKIRIDTNSWKTFVLQRVTSPVGSKGSLTIYNASEAHHKMLIEHMTSERATPIAGNGRVVNVFKMKPTRENHLFDCVVGSHVAASEQGILGIGHNAAPKEKKTVRRKYSVKF